MKPMETLLGFTGMNLSTGGLMVALHQGSPKLFSSAWGGTCMCAKFHSKAANSVILTSEDRHSQQDFSSRHVNYSSPDPSTNELAARLISELKRKDPKQKKPNGS